LAVTGGLGDADQRAVPVWLAGARLWQPVQVSQMLADAIAEAAPAFLAVPAVEADLELAAAGWRADKPKLD
jgi:hypothetical protein